jgi:hypothetical protein
MKKKKLRERWILIRLSYDDNNRKQYCSWMKRHNVTYIINKHMILVCSNDPYFFRYLKKQLGKEGKKSILEANWIFKCQFLHEEDIDDFLSEVSR